MDVGTNSVAAGIALTLTGGIVTFLVARVSKSHDARAAAEASWAAMPLQIIDQQNKRIDEQNRHIDQLRNDMNALWKRERECQSQLDELSERNELLKAKVEALEEMVPKRRDP